MTDRTIQPPIVIPKRVKTIALSDSQSESGVPIYRLLNEGYDVVRISFVFRAGITSQHKPFLASSVINNIAEGTTKHTAAEIADRIDYYGIMYDVSADMDYAIVTLCSLRRFFGEALAILEEILTGATFPDHEFGVYAAKKKQMIAMQRAKVSYLSQEHFQNILFGDGNPYGEIFDPANYDNLTTADLRDFYKNNYTAENLFVILSGDSAPEDIAAVARIADSVPCGTKAIPVVPPTMPTRDFYLRKEGSLQSALKMGRVLFNKQHPDFIGMQVVAKILGGYFGSRLISSLREDKGYTYGIFSSIVNTDTTGYLIISGEVVAQYTDEAAEVVFDEIARLRDELVGDKELAMVKSVMVGEVMRILDGPFGVADVLIENIQNGRSNADINYIIAEINGTSAGRVRDLARRYLKRDDISTVIVGERNCR